MTSKDRVLAAMCGGKQDRVPMDFSANQAVASRLMKKLNVADSDGIMDALDTDIRYLLPEYAGAPLFKQKDGLVVNSEYGFYTRYVANPSGGYWDFTDFPLLGVDDEIIANYPVPCADNFDYGACVNLLPKYNGRAVFTGGSGTCDIINSLSRVMGMEEALVRLMSEDEATLKYLNRKCDMELLKTERMILAAKGGIDFMWIGEDLGTQTAPMISESLYDNIISPYHKKFADLAKTYKLPLMFHSCGSSSWVYERLIKMGINCIDTLQPEATNMSPQYLANKFKSTLSFHGCISTAGKLVTGSEEDVENEVKTVLKIMMPHKRYILSPTHMIQDNTPINNIIALYKSGKKYGVYKV